MASPTPPRPIANGLRLAACVGAFTLGGLVTGCGNEPPTAANLPARSSARTADWTAADRLARLFALGLRDSTARTGVRDALRASRVNEHRVSLQQFVGGADGVPLVAAAARAGGVSEVAVRALVASLPPADLLVPYTAHRRAWRATPDVVVGTLGARRDSLIPAYDSDGDQTIVNGNAPAAARTLVMIERAHGKDLRIDAQPPDRAGAVIQDADDGEMAGSVAYQIGRGRWAVAQLAHFMTARGARPGELRRKPGTQIRAMEVACDPTAVDCGSADPPPPDPEDTSSVVVQPGDTTYYDPTEPEDSVNSPVSVSLVAGPPPPDTTFLVKFFANYKDSMIDSYVEPYFKTRYLGALSVVRFKHIKEHKWYYVNTPLIHRRFTEGTLDYVEVEVWEDEKWNPDWHCIDADHATIRVPIGAVRPGEQVHYDCHGWAGVDFVTDWTLKPRPPVASVRVRIPWGSLDTQKLFAGCTSVQAPSITAYTAGGARLDITNDVVTLGSDHPQAATLVQNPKYGPNNLTRFLLYANGPGPAKLMATVEGVTGYLDVVVDPGLTSVALAPTSASISVGTSQQLAATAYVGSQPVSRCSEDLNGAGVYFYFDLVPTVWRSENPSVATVSATGVVTAVAPGSTVIHASIGIYESTATVYVTTVNRVAVSPPSATIDVGSRLQLSATPVDFSGALVPGKTVTWTSGNPDVAYVTSSGLVTGRMGGRATIYATVDGMRGTSVITVLAPTSGEAGCGTKKIC